MINNPALDKCYISINGKKLFRIKAKSPSPYYKNILSGEVDVFIDFYGDIKKITSFYSSNNLLRIGNEIMALSWHSFIIENKGFISGPKVHFKDINNQKISFDSGDHVKYSDVILYPIVSMLIKKPWEFISNDIFNQENRKNFETIYPVCVDLFILPKKIGFLEFNKEFDSSAICFISTNSIYMPSTGFAFERCKYADTEFPRIHPFNLNGWDMILRLSNIPRYAYEFGLPDYSIISFDLKEAVSSILDRPICYPGDDETTFLKTTFRERLNPNIKYETWYKK
jgi:hypothetical protein